MLIIFLQYVPKRYFSDVNVGKLEESSRATLPFRRVCLWRHNHFTRETGRVACHPPPCGWQAGHRPINLLQNVAIYAAPGLNFRDDDVNNMADFAPVLTSTWRNTLNIGECLYYIRTWLYASIRFVIFMTLPLIQAKNFLLETNFSTWKVDDFFSQRGLATKLIRMR